MAAKWLQLRSTKFTFFTALYVAVVLGVLVLINFLANRYDKSWDSTANKQFSLADETIKIVKGLKTDVHATYFGGRDSFPSARDLLDRYSDLSPRFHVDYVDPDRQPQEAKTKGYRSDSPVVLDIGAKREGAKSLSEEEITGALIRAVKTGGRTICVLSGAKEHSIEEEGGGGYGLLKKVLERDNYAVKAVDLKGATPGDATKTLNLKQSPPPEPVANVTIPSDCSVVIVGGPQFDYPPATVAALKSFEEGGGRELIMLDNVMQIGRDEAPAQNVGLTNLLTEWGVTLNKDLVLDFSGVGQFLGLRESVAVVVNYESHPITAPLMGGATGVPTAFPLARSLTTKSTDKTTVSKLFGTTANSVAITGINPDGSIDPKTGTKGPLTLAAAGTYNGSPAGRFVVVGTSLWSQNSMIGSGELGNRDLLANMVNWLASDEELISIRPKQAEDRPVTMTAMRYQMMFWLSIVVFPLAVVLFGVATWVKRR